MIGILAIATPVAADVYVGNFAPPSVTVYAPGAVGNAAPVRTISGALTGLVSPESVTVDVVNNELYVTDFFGTAIRVYALGANGNVAPLRTIVDGPNSQLQQPRMVAVDTANNEILVLSGNDGIRAFPRTASGDAVPLRTIKGANTKLNTGITLVLDPVNNELITNSYDVGAPAFRGSWYSAEAPTATWRRCGPSLAPARVSERSPITPRSTWSTTKSFRRATTASG